MADTGLPSRPWQPGNVAQYQFWTADYPREDPLKQSRPYWEIMSTVDDLYRWYLALRNDRVLTAASKTKGGGLLTTLMIRSNLIHGADI
jgi:hypothetical protein